MKQNRGLFLKLTFIAFLPYLLYSFQYFPILDDYIQYWAFPAYHDLSYVYLTIGSLSTRPLASLLDPTLWGSLWLCLSLALLFITAFHLLSGWLLYKTLNRFQVSVTPFFWLIYFMAPLGMEGRFWLSASSRVIMGLFFAAVSLFFLSAFIQKKKGWKYFFVFCLFQLISCGFYEAASVFSVTAAVLLFFLGFWRKREKRLFAVPAASVINISLMFAYYKLFAALGSGTSRASGRLKLAALPAGVKEMLRQVGEIFSLTYERVILGCRDGIQVLCGSGLWGIFILLLIIFAAFCLCLQREERKKKNTSHVLLFETAGLILFLAPLIPNLLTEDIWITNRSMFFPLIGLALMAEPLFGLLRGRVKKAALFVMAFVFITAGVNEYDVFRRVHLQDEQLLDAVVEQMSPEAKAGQQKVIVVLSEEVKTEQNAYYKDHVKSVFDSDWALTGAVRARLQDLSPRSVQPVLAGDDFEAEDAQVIYIGVS